MDQTPPLWPTPEPSEADPEDRVVEFFIADPGTVTVSNQKGGIVVRVVSKTPPVSDTEVPAGKKTAKKKKEVAVPLKRVRGTVRDLRANAFPFALPVNDAAVDKRRRDDDTEGEFSDAVLSDDNYYKRVELQQRKREAREAKARKEPKPKHRTSTAQVAASVVAAMEHRHHTRTRDQERKDAQEYLEKRAREETRKKGNKTYTESRTDGGVLFRNMDGEAPDYDADDERVWVDEQPLAEHHYQVARIARERMEEAEEAERAVEAEEEMYAQRRLLHQPFAHAYRRLRPSEQWDPEFPTPRSAQLAIMPRTPAELIEDKKEAVRRRKLNPMAFAGPQFPMSGFMAQ